MRKKTPKIYKINGITLLKKKTGHFVFMKFQGWLVFIHLPQTEMVSHLEWPTLRGGEAPGRLASAGASAEARPSDLVGRQRTLDLSTH